MGSDEIHELTAAYALSALDPESERDYEEHLRHCARCREDLVSLQEAAASLAYAVEAPEPPRRLRERLLDAAASDRSNVVPLRRPWVLPALSAAAAAAAGVAIALGVWGSSLSSSLDEERQARADQDAVIALVSAQGSQQFPVSRADGTHDGTLVVSTDGAAGLVLTGIPDAPEGKTYEIWVIENGVPRPAGLFEGGQSSTVALTETVPPGATVAVTVEPEGGVEAPTGDPVLTAPTA